jgi:hypothetical protein
LEIPIPAEKIIVKFAFTNRKWVPRGIRLIPRQEGGIEAKHHQQGRRAGLRDGGLGAVRRNRVDTGRHKQFDNVDLAPTWKKLKEQLIAVDVHCFLQERSHGMKKPIVVVTFQKEGKNNKKIIRLLTQIEANLVNHGTWGIIHH